MKKQNVAYLLLAAYTLSSGCSRSVTILRPDENATLDQRAVFEVKFNPRADQGTFVFELDGQNVTASFAGGATAPAPCFVGGSPGGPFGEHTLRAYADMSPSRPFDVLGYTISFRPAAISFEHSGGTRAPVSGPPVIRGSTGSGGGSGTGSSATIGVPVRQPSDLHVRETQVEGVQMLVPSAPPSPLAVTLTPASNIISIDNQPAGAAVTVTIPNNDRRASFNIRGIQAGTTEITACVEGYQQARLPVRVWR